MAGEESLAAFLDDGDTGVWRAAQFGGEGSDRFELEIVFQRIDTEGRKLARAVPRRTGRCIRTIRVRALGFEKSVHDPVSDRI